MENTLKFYLGEESHYIIEDYKNRKSSVFADQYKKALEIIDRYIEPQNATTESKQEDLRNNIIAFLGDRGTGKTSCMLSVLEMLTKHHLEVLPQKHKEKSFAQIDVIDPSFFDENTNILFLVIGKMFSAFKDELEKNKVLIDHQERDIHNLKAAFHSVQSYLSRMHKSPLDDNDSAINQLSNLLITVDLKKSLENLVNKYLHFFGNDYLVIPIDDIDNNTEHAYTMAEQLRKYLVLPNVIILISFKLEQLTQVVNLYFTKLYEPLVKQKSLTINNIGDMTQKYLLKLFPLTQRIALPDMNVLMDRELSVYEKREDTSPVLFGSSVKYTMTALIFRKTRYLFYHSDGENCPIVPTNLREYRTLFSMLYRMPNYREEKDEYNKLLFRQYFFEEWVDKHLNEKGKVIAQKLTANNEAGSFNKLVLTELSSLAIDISKFKEEGGEDEELIDTRTRRSSNSTNKKLSEFQQIIDSNNTTYNISIGDVFAVLGEIKKRAVSEEDKMLLFFIESLYSIRLYHYYDELTESDKNSECTNNSIDETIKRLDELDGISNYERLIGGDFFNPRISRFLPMEGSNERGFRVINIQPIKDLLRKNESIENVSLNIIEFFALTLSRRLQGKTKNDLSPTYRQLKEVYYHSDFKNAQKAIFDLGSFFSNITNIKFAYDRLSDKLYKIAEENKNSLLNQLRNLTKDREDTETYKDSRFRSWCCIRNAVILQEFGNSFEYVRTGRTRSSDQLQLLHDFFKEVSNFHIKTYDKKENEKDAYEITFDYSEVFTEFFRKLQRNSKGKSLFEKIFNTAEDETGSLDIEMIFRRMPQEITKDKLEKRIKDKNQNLIGNQNFWNAFDEKIKDRKIPKEQAKAYLEQLKNDFDL